MPSHNVLHDEIRAHIISLVQGGEVGRGDPLSDYRLAKALGVSRTPVRSVLDQLAEDGVVQRAKRGWTVASLKVEDGSGPDDLVARILRDRVLGRIEREVFESGLMERYDASRAAVKRAMERLSVDGLVARRRGHGWEFTEALSSHQALMESYVFRELLECGALERDDWQDDPEERSDLMARHAAILTRKMADLDPADWFDTNRRFHEYIAAGSRNSFVTRALAQQNRLRRLWEYAEFSHLTPDRIQTSCSEHMAIMRAISEKDLSFAAALLRRHLRKSAR